MQVTKLWQKELYYGARYYAGWLGRWTAADPAGLVDGGNLYAYCRGNPTKYADPTGMHPIYDTDGNLLGTDDNGLQGRPIVMNKGNFKQGRSYEDATTKNVSIRAAFNISGEAAEKNIDGTTYRALFLKGIEEKCNTRHVFMKSVIFTLAILLLFNLASGHEPYSKLVKKIPINHSGDKDSISVYLCFMDGVFDIDPLQVVIIRDNDKFYGNKPLPGDMYVDIGKKSSPYYTTWGRNVFFLWGKNGGFIFLYKGDILSVFPPIEVYELKNGCLNEIHAPWWWIFGLELHILQNIILYLAIAALPILFFLLIRKLWRKERWTLKLMALFLSLCCLFLLVALFYLANGLRLFISVLAIFVAFLVAFTTHKNYMKKILKMTFIAFTILFLCFVAIQIYTRVYFEPESASHILKEELMNMDNDSLIDLFDKELESLE